MAEFFLRSHVFFCTAPHGCVFLDATRGRYFGLNESKAHALSAVLHGCPQQGNLATSIDKESAASLATDLVREGFLTENECDGKPATPIPVEFAETQIDWDGIKPSVHWHHVLTFFTATVLTALILRGRPHAEVINWLSKRKSDCENVDIRTAHDLSLIFRLVRPFGYTAKNHCLFDSIVLMRFLSFYDVHPSLVFGVRARPFSAHCWVQVKNLVLNCPVEYARSFTPIRAI